MCVSPERARQVLAATGVYATSACDGCKRLIGHVRWTREGDPREWCSQECREQAVGKLTQTVASRKRASRTH